MSLSFCDILQAQSTLHPSLTPQDAIKLCYQASFGAEHLLNDPIGAKAFFDAEYNTLPPQAMPNEPLLEQISSDFYRINLRVWKAQNLPANWLFQLFVQSMTHQNTLPTVANTQCEAQNDNASGTAISDPTKQVNFGQNAADILLQCKQGTLPFSATEWEQAFAAYLKDGVRAVHHSATYRNAEQPAYRLVAARFIPYLPVLQYLAALPTPANDCATVIAIDGRCGAGKTTLAQILRDTLETDLIQMDDFFLPPAKRTPERLATPGGNVDYERFAQEVLPALGKKKAFSYQRFHCATMQLGEFKQIRPTRWQIVEGSYSQHPYFKRYADCAFFVTINPERQIARIRKRNGDAWAKDFTEKWIPMEEAYFSAYNIEANADFVVSI